MAAARAESQPRSLRPSEGWLTVVALGAMLLVLGLAVDDAHWAGWVPATGASQTAFLPWTLLLGALMGLVAAKLRWHPLAAHAVGALVGALWAIYAVAGALPQVEGANIPADDPFRLVNLMASLQAFLRDVLVRQVRSDQTSAFLLVVAIVGWASGQFAAFAVFRHHRPMSAVLFLGLLLLASMSLTLQHQYLFLVAYAAAALFLLVRLSLAEQRVLWGHTKLGDATAAFSLYLRNGVLFIVVALVGSLFLTSVASSAPLHDMWTGSEDQFTQWALQFDRFASGVVAPIRGPAALFGNSETIRGFWVATPGVAYTVRTSDIRGYYWRGATYDEFDGHTWKQTDQTTSRTVAAGDPVLAGTADQVKPGKGLNEVTVTVTPEDAAGSDVVLSPATPVSVSAPARAQTAGIGGPFDAIKLNNAPDQGQSYQVTALVPDTLGNDSVTANQLAAAGTVYPDWAKRYISIVPGSIGSLVEQTSNSIVSRLPASERDPYHIAKAFQDWLYSGGGFVYDVNVQGVCSPGTDVADCLLQSKRGYCEYFATTLAMMLRTQQIPARYVLGYLPGRAMPGPAGIFEVDRAAAHAWVEVYFPKYGWVRFDATPGNTANGQTPTNLPAGAPVPTPSAKPGATPAPRPSPSFVPSNGGDVPSRPIPGEGNSGAGGAGDSQGGDPIPMLLGLAILGLAFAGALWLWVRAAKVASPGAAFQGVSRIASRFGYAQRPAQTVYEYASMLGDVLPAARPDLEMVAHAKVEATYGRRIAEAEAIAAVRRAYARLRLRLFRLALMYRRRRR